MGCSDSKPSNVVEQSSDLRLSELKNENDALNNQITSHMNATKATAQAEIELEEARQAKRVFDEKKAAHEQAEKDAIAAEEILRLKMEGNKDLKTNFLPN
jgi:hypothetical protein